MLKENQIMKKACFIIHQWSFHNFMPFTSQTMIFLYNYKLNDGFYSPNSLQSLFNSFKNYENEMNSLENILY